MQCIRMVRLMRAAKFLSERNTLKDRKGFESMGAVNSVFTAVFVLVFISHLSGCLFTILATASPT
jgi:hypothetical protein